MYTEGFRNGLEEMGSGDIKKKVYLRCFFCYRKYVGDVRQSERDILDLLELIMKPPGLVKE